MLRALPYAPVTREVAACMTTNLGELDEDAAERALIEAAGEGVVRREAVGDGALWHLVASASGARARAAPCSTSRPPSRR